MMTNVGRCAWGKANNPMNVWTFVPMRRCSKSTSVLSIHVHSGLPLCFELQRLFTADCRFVSSYKGYVI